MEKKVTVSVIMGVYNPNTAYFLQAIHSIINQDLPEWELLIYDDGSETKYKPLINKAATMDQRIWVIGGKTNRGLGYALNQCIRQSSGTYIARMDDDDISLPGRLKKQICFLESHLEYAWVGSNAELIDSHGVWGKLKMPRIPHKASFLHYSPYIHPSVMFRREVLEQVHGYSTSRKNLLCEDYELFMRLHQKGYQGYNLQKPLLLYREDIHSETRRAYKRRIRETVVRLAGFRQLGILKPSSLPYVLKPLLVGLIPSKARHQIRRRIKAGGNFLRYGSPKL